MARLCGRLRTDCWVTTQMQLIVSRRHLLALWKSQNVSACATFSALLVNLATSRAIDQLRRRFRKPRFCANKADLAAVPSSNPGPAQQLQTQELAVKLREALAQLPQQEAEVFCLRCLNDMSYRQIAKELGIKSKTTGVLLHRARRKLRDFLEVSI